ncbi:MAG TPA: asparagine synthase (glutamine-hydrolyzing) [Puia sp.]|jgi:asparagine synthase (glutamine-hydrolysing)|nr:asparagine synthase (glutamine-hydrolyzing) [Puia sp.]
MCGIAGILSPDPVKLTPDRLKLMTDALAHRGPDGEGHWLDPAGHIGLGHRRLSIIDLSPAGIQPMTYLDRYTVIHNGEIYNYIELRELLQSKGYTFSTRTDTEIIPAAYDHYGADCLQHFEGMFAFALWDKQERQLFLARDRFGEKPLFLFQDETQFLFASEMKALWAAGIPKTFNPPMLFNFITLGYTQNPADPAETFYKGITKLPARSFLQYNTVTRQQQIRAYWDPITHHPRAAKRESAILEEFDALLSASVRRRLRSDVAIGASLSGGLDSSAIVAYALGQPDPPKALPAFSAIFPGFEKDESFYIDKIARHFSLTNYSITPTAADLVNDLDRLAAHQEEPFQSSSIYAQYQVHSLAKAHGITVLLDGQGADELLAGYPKYFTWYWRELYRSNPKALMKELDATQQPGARKEWTWKHRLAAMMPDLAASFQKRRRITRQHSNKDLSRDFVRASGVSYYELPPICLLNEVLYYNSLTNGLEELLRYADRNSMAHGVEIRLPFLDHRLAEFLFSLPANFKIRGGWTKWLLRQSTERMLPHDIVWRKVKTGYEPPQEQWMNNPALLDRIREAKRRLVNEGLLDRTTLQKKIQPMGAHAAESYDWRYLVTAACLV